MFARKVNAVDIEAQRIGQGHCALLMLSCLTHLPHAVRGQALIDTAGHIEASDRGRNDSKRCNTARVKCGGHDKSGHGGGNVCEV